jgi:glucosyl-3-phosphoglycerate synthase
MFTEHPFDHKHQAVSKDDQAKGLNRMAVDAVTILMNALVIEEGLEFSDTFFRNLAITYRAVAEELIKKYSDDASFNHLQYERNGQEELVKSVFQPSISI